MAASKVPYVVILTTPAYGTLCWGPFACSREAQDWIDAGGHHEELLAAYETVSPPGLVVFTCPLYSTECE